MLLKLPAPKETPFFCLQKKGKDFSRFSGIFLFTLNAWKSYFFKFQKELEDGWGVLGVYFKHAPVLSFTPQ